MSIPAVGTYNTGYDEAASRRPRAFYFMRHFRGELTFKVSFWVNYFGGLHFLTLISYALIYAKDEFSLITFSYLALAFSLVKSFGMPWLMVGTWRSASNYVAQGGKRLWSISAKAVILVGAYYSVKMIVFQTIPMIPEYGGIITGDKETRPYGVIVHSDGKIIQFRGGLRAGAEGDFRDKLRSSTQIRVLQIESDGGRLSEGMRIGRMVRNAGLATVVSTHCESAATFLLMSGKERIITRGAKIGFHRPSGVGSNDAEYENVRQFMEDAGISKDFVDRVLATSPDDMWYPTYEEMFQAGVVTGEFVDGKIRR